MESSYKNGMITCGYVYGGITTLWGCTKIYSAGKKIEQAQQIDKLNTTRYNSSYGKAKAIEDELTHNKIEILASFDEFSKLWSRIHNTPSFAEISIGVSSIPTINFREIQDVSVWATIAVAGVKSVSLGILGLSVVKPIVQQFSKLFGNRAQNSNQPAENPTVNNGLDSLTYGSALAAMSGTAVLCCGFVSYRQAEKSYQIMKENERKINSFCAILDEFSELATKYNEALMRVRKVYEVKMTEFSKILESFTDEIIDWNSIAKKDQELVELMVMLVQLLYQMCKCEIKRVGSNQNSDQIEFNKGEIYKQIETSDKVLEQIAY